MEKDRFKARFPIALRLAHPYIIRMTTHTHITSPATRVVVARDNGDYKMTYDVKAIVAALTEINDKIFTVADLARQLKLDPKIARRRVRANEARDKNARMKRPNEIKTPTRANRKWEFTLSQANVEAMIEIIKS